MEPLEQDIMKLKDEIDASVKKMAEIKKFMEANKGASEKKEDGDAPKDNFLGVMGKFFTDAVKEGEDLVNRFNTLIKRMTALCVQFGEKKDVKPEEFFELIETILETWGKARQALDKIAAEEKKKQKLLEKKKKIKKKLEKRPTHENLRNSGIIKTKNDVKNQKRKRKLCVDTINSLLKKKLQEMEFSRVGSRTRHFSVFVAKIPYVCQHCGEHAEKVVDFDKIKEIRDDFRHECFASVEDRNNNIRSMQHVPFDGKMDKCPFNHIGPCMHAVMDPYSHQVPQKLRKNKPNLPRYGTSAEIKPNGKYPFAQRDLIETKKELQEWRQNYEEGKISASKNARLQYNNRVNGYRSGSVHSPQGSLGGKGMLHIYQNKIYADPANFVNENKETDDDYYSSVIHSDKLDNKNPQPKTGNLRDLRSKRSRRGKGGKGGKGGHHGDGGHHGSKAPKSDKLHSLYQKTKKNRKTRKNHHSKREENQFGTGKQDITIATHGTKSREEHRIPSEEMPDIGQPMLNNNQSTTSSVSVSISDGGSSFNTPKARRSGEIGNRKIRIENLDSHKISAMAAPDAQFNEMNLSPSHRGNKGIRFNFDESGNGNSSDNNNDKGQYNRRARTKVRDSVFGMKPMKSMGASSVDSVFDEEKNSGGGPGMMHRRRSVAAINPQGEIFRVNETQAQKLCDQSFLKDLRAEFEQFGRVNYNDHHSTLQVTFKQAQIRDDGIKLLEEYLGSKLISYIQQKRKVIYKELRFPLSNKQIDLLSDVKNYELLLEEMAHFGTINLDVDHLVLKTKINEPSIYAIHKLEKRLGVLLKDEEVHKIMNDLNCDLQEISNHSKRQQFLDKMMKTVTYGARMTKHKKRSQPTHRWILIHNDRLFWKESVQHRNHISRSLHLTKIIQIMPGKNTRALKECEIAAVV